MYQNCFFLKSLQMIKLDWTDWETDEYIQILPEISSATFSCKEKPYKPSPPENKVFLNSHLYGKKKRHHQPVHLSSDQLSAHIDKLDVLTVQLQRIKLCLLDNPVLWPSSFLEDVNVKSRSCDWDRAESFVSAIDTYTRAKGTCTPRIFCLSSSLSALSILSDHSLLASLPFRPWTLSNCKSNTHTQRREWFNAIDGTS